jgi:hypothetical protein
MISIMRLLVTPMVQGTAFCALIALNELRQPGGLSVRVAAPQERTEFNPQPQRRQWYVHYSGRFVNMNPLHLHVEGTDLSRAGSRPFAACLLAQYEEIGFLPAEHCVVGT